MFLTGAAQNLLCIKLAQELGVIIPNVWMTWFKLAFLPGAFQGGERGEGRGGRGDGREKERGSGAECRRLLGILFLDIVLVH